MQKKSSIHSVADNATPILKVVCMLSAGYPAVRKYYRSLVLPPITDVKQSPEDGDSPRAVLCRLLTSPDSTLSVMVAEFIFILCKESGMKIYEAGFIQMKPAKHFQSSKKLVYLVLVT